MNILGLNISFNSNNKYVKRKECHEAQDRIRADFSQRFDDLKDFINIRFEDIKDFLIKNGK